MNTLIHPFKLAIPLIGEHDFRVEGNRKYLCFSCLPAPSNPNSLPESHLFTFGPRQGILMIPEDNSVLVNQIKNRSENALFTTPLTNLKFKPDFINISEGMHNNPIYYSSLLIKDPNQIEKLSEVRNPGLPEITFKVVKQYKEDQENGNYKHVLETEPLDLGIEDFPKITKLLFLFSECSNAPATEKSLKKSKFYNSSVLNETIGKTFSMKVKCWNFGLRNSKYHKDMNVLNFQDSNDFDFNSFQEKTTESNDNPVTPIPKPSNNNLSTSLSNEGNKGIIIGGVILFSLVLALIAFFIVMKKQRKK